MAFICTHGDINQHSFTSLVRLTLLAVTIWGLPSATKHHSHRNGLYKPSRQLEVYSWVYNIDTYFFSTPKIDRTVQKCSEPGMREASEHQGRTDLMMPFRLGPDHEMSPTWKVIFIDGRLYVWNHTGNWWSFQFFSLNLFGGWDRVWLKSYGDGWTPNIAFFRGINIH